MSNGLPYFVKPPGTWESDGHPFPPRTGRMIKENLEILNGMDTLYSLFSGGIPTAVIVGTADGHPPPRTGRTVNESSEIVNIGDILQTIMGMV